MVLRCKLAGDAHNAITRVTQGFTHEHATAHVLTSRIKTSQCFKSLGAHVWVEVPSGADDKVKRTVIIQFGNRANNCRVDNTARDIRISSSQAVATFIRAVAELNDHS